MAKQIKGSDIFEGDIFKVVVDGAEVAKEKLKELNTELVNVGKSFKTELKGIKADNVKEIEALIKKTKELTDAVKLQTQTTIEQQKIERELNKTKEQLAREKEKTKREELKTQEQINRQQQKQIDLTKKESDAYKELVKNTRELKNESKRLGAEMLALEQAGQKNSKEYARLSRTYKDVTASAKQGDEALKKLDARVGDNFRNVGNYEKGVARLKNVLSQLGLAFGGITIAKNLFDTQVQLDSLRLSLRNVSKSTAEYQSNMSFLKDISNAYGQDLIVMIDSYKNFIASTESSTLSLKERKRVYESIVKAGASLALTDDAVKGSLLAVTQMFSKGAVSAEELRQQLGERLPGAFSIMAESMGVSEKKLAEMMKNGEVMADDVMPRFAIMLERTFGTNAKARLETLGGAWNVLKNNVTEYIDNAQRNIDLNKSLSKIFIGLGKNIDVVLKSVRQLVVSFITMKTLLIANSIRVKIMNGAFLDMSKNALKSGESIKILGQSFKSLSFLVIIDGLVQLTEHFLDLAKGTNIARKSYERYVDSTNRGNKNANDFLTIQNDKIRNYRIEQQALLDTGKITEKVFKERMSIAQKERDLNIKNKIDDLKRESDYYNKKRLLYRNQFKDQKPTIPEAPIGVKSAVLQPGSLGYLITNVLGGEKSEQQIEYEKDVAIYNKKLKLYNDYIKLGAESNRAITEMQKLQNDLRDSEILSSKTASNSSKKASKDVLEHTKAVKDINTEYKTTNEYLDKQIELLQRLNQIVAERTISGAEANTQQVIQNELELAGKTGRYSDRSVANAVQREVKIRLDAEEKYYESIEKLDDEHIKNKYDKERKKLEAEKSDKELALLDLEVEYERRRKDFGANDPKNLGKGARTQVKKEAEWLIAQEEYIAKAKLEIKEGYEEKARLIGENETKEIEDNQTKQLADFEEHESKKLQIIDEGNKKIRQFGEEAERIVAERRLNEIKTLSASINDLIQKSLNHYINFAERRIQNLEAVMNKTQNQIDFMQQKAVAGSIQATESLAELDKQQIEDQKKKMQEQKNIQKLQIAMTIFQAYANNIQNAEVGENPFTKTLTDVTKLTALIASVPTFYEGTETTVADALGTPQLQGKDGYLVRVDGAEKVLNPTLSKMTGNMTTMEIAKLAEDKLRGNIIHKGEGAIQLMNNSWSTDVIVSKLDSLEKTIKNKPEYSAQVGEIIGGVMHVVETKKVGNTRVRDITRFS